MTLNDILRIGAVIVFVITGVILIITDDVELRTALALTDFGLAAFAASAFTWPRTP
jgi:hypothetical protein